MSELIKLLNDDWLEMFDKSRDYKQCKIHKEYRYIDKINGTLTTEEVMDRSDKEFIERISRGESVRNKIKIEMGKSEKLIIHSSQSIQDSTKVHIEISSLDLLKNIRLSTFKGVMRINLVIGSVRIESMYCETFEYLRERYKIEDNTLIPSYFLLQGLYVPYHQYVRLDIELMKDHNYM